MSGETDAIIGIVVAPIALAGVMVYGAARAVGWIAGQAYNAYKAHNNRKQIELDNMSDETARLFREFQSSFAEEDAQLQESIKSMQISMKAQSDAMYKKLNALDFTEDYANECNAAVDSALTHMESFSRERIHYAETEGRRRFANQVRTLKTDRQTTQAMLNSLKADKAAYEAKTRELAGRALHDVEEICRQLRDDGSGNMALWKLEYDKAETEYRSGNYAAAYSNATALLDKIAEVLIDQHAEAQVNRIRRVNLLMQANAELARLQALTDTKLKYEGHLVRENLTRYYPKMFRAVAAGLSEAVDLLDSEKELGRGELEQIKETISDAAGDLEELSRAAVHRMYASYHANDAARVLKKKLAEQNFTLDGYAYEGDLEGRPMHVNFKNALTGETLTVVLDPCSDPGKVAMRVLKYGDGKNPQPDPKRQKDLEDLITGAVSATDVKCRMPGKNATDEDAKQLDKIKKISTQD